MSKIDPTTWLGRSLAAQRQSEWRPARVDAVDVIEIGDGAIRLLVFLQDATTAGPLHDLAFIIPASGNGSARLAALLHATGVDAPLAGPAQLEGRHFAIRGNGDLPEEFAPLSEYLQAA